MSRGERYNRDIGSLFDSMHLAMITAYVYIYI